MKAYSNKVTNQILEGASNIVDNYEKTLFVFAGPNGSGKSTLLANVYFDGLLNSKYVNADMFCRTIFGDIKDINKRNETSMYYTMEMVNKSIKEGKSFCYETVMSHPSKIDIIQNAKDNGYKIISVLVYTENPQINVHRVEMRAKQGGHDVPKDKIIARYYRTMALAQKLEQISDEFYKFDNSAELEIVDSVESSAEM